LLFGSGLMWLLGNNSNLCTPALITMGTACSLAVFLTSTFTANKYNSESTLTKTTISLLPALPLFLGLIAVMVCHIGFALLTISTFPFYVSFIAIPGLLTAATSFISLLLLSLGGSSAGHWLARKRERLNFRREEVELLQDA